MDASPFGKLSAELRNEIYDIASKTEGGAFVELVKDDSGTYVWRIKPHTCHLYPLALTEVCREVRSETLGAFIALNSISLIVPILDDSEVVQYAPPWYFAVKIKDWLHNLHPKNRTELKSIELDLGTWSFLEERCHVGADSLAGALFDTAKVFHTASVSAMVWISMSGTDPLNPRKSFAIAFKLSLYDVIELRTAQETVFDQQRKALRAGYHAGRIGRMTFDTRRSRLEKCCARLSFLRHALETMIDNHWTSRRNP